MPWFPKLTAKPGVCEAVHQKLEEIDKTKGQVRAMHPHRHDERAMKWLLQPNVGAVLGQLLGVPPLACRPCTISSRRARAAKACTRTIFTSFRRPPPASRRGPPSMTPMSRTAAFGSCPDPIATRFSARKRNNAGKDVDGIRRHQHHKIPPRYQTGPVPVPRGSTMFFGGNVIHGSGPNRTENRWRRTFIGHYIDEAPTRSRATITRSRHAGRNRQRHCGRQKRGLVLAATAGKAQFINRPR